MNPLSAVEGNYPGSSSTRPDGCDYELSSPQDFMLPPEPMEGLHDPGPPLFLTKTFDIVEDPSTNHIVSWSRGGASFVVFDPYSFSANLLPRYFKHNNFSSFIRQLNTYGFRKIDPDRWEFANEAFLMGQRQLLKSIKSRKQVSQSLFMQELGEPSIKIGRNSFDGERDRLKRDKQALMLELSKLRNRQRSARYHISAMEQRLESAEQKQRQMTSLLAHAMRSPEFLSQLLLQRRNRRGIDDMAKGKQGMTPIDQGPSGIETLRSAVPVVKTEPFEFGFEISELEALALEMQGYGVRRGSVAIKEEGDTVPESVERELDDSFWDELLSNERLDEDYDHEDVNVLADRLGYLSSSP